MVSNVIDIIMKNNLILFAQISGRFKSKQTHIVGFITKIHIRRYVRPIFMSKNFQRSEVLEYIFAF